MPTVAERVARGAEWLDTNRPLWLNVIDLDTLDLSSPCRCILGQTYGNWWDRPAELEDDSPYGFSLFDLLDDYATDDEAYEALTAEWRRVITARREATA